MRTFIEKTCVWRTLKKDQGFARKEANETAPRASVNEVSALIGPEGANSLFERGAWRDNFV